ncbi:MAG: Rieske 2Fe-2S domain-containing protein [Chloroflexi bacterium]|nr:Rieske 2Fe-2S domain-containing protein [Chloroflexota bacterium]
MTINAATPQKKTLMTRRQFFAWAWAAAIVALGGQAIAMLVRFIQPVSTSGFGGLVRAGKVDEFTPGSISQIKAGRFFLYRMNDGSFLAMYQKCTHLGCSVPWVPDEDQFHCPCHGTLFDKTGQVLGGPAPRPLDLFSVVIKNGEVFVDTGNPIQRQKFDPSQTMKA